MKIAILSMALLLVIGSAAWKLCYPRAIALLPTPALSKQWHDQVYGLDDDEGIRFIAQRLPLERATPLLAVGVTGQTLHIVRANGRVDPVAWTSRTGTVRSALADCVNLPGAELRVEDPAGGVAVDGDWIIRDNAPQERRMQALTPILQSVTQNKIEITANPIYAYCVLVQGSWNPPEKAPGQPKPLRFASSVYQATPGLMQGPPEDFLRLLEENCRCRFIDQTVDRPKNLSWLNDPPNGYWDASDRRTIFRTLESQTSLRFTETRRAIPIWTVRQRSGRQKQPGR